MVMEPDVILDIDSDGVARITLNRPETRNAINEHVITELTSIFERLGDDKDIRVILLRGNGKCFSAGADLDWMRRMASYTHDENIRDANALAKMLYTLNFLPHPTIAAVHGAAMGGGAGLACCCDIAVAASSCIFAFSETGLGLIPATISPYVIEAIGSHAARRYFVTAERFNADTAFRLGLVSEVAQDELLEERVNQLIETILHNGPLAVGAAKQLIFDVAGQPHTAELMQTTSKRIADIRASTEGKEGITAFLEKRKPAWIK